MEQCDIIAELIKLDMFDGETLTYLFIVNKNFNKIIINKFCQLQSRRHQECIDSGDTIDLLTFCTNYMQKLRYPRKRFPYDYCCDCYTFGLIDDINEMTCQFGCMLNCCGMDSIVSKEINTTIVLNCGCRVIERYGNVCTCGRIVISNIVKCGCGSIPLRYVDPNDKFRKKYLKYKSKYTALSEQHKQPTKTGLDIPSTNMGLDTPPMNLLSTSDEWLDKNIMHIL